MATGGSIGNTAGDDDEGQQNASADGDTTTVIRHTCTPCSRKGNIREALHYCTECNEFYCGQCMGFHRLMGQLQHHVVYGKSDIDKWGRNIRRQQLTEKCAKHPTEIVNMFCFNDNELCCHVCVSLEHSTCNNKKYIPTAASGILETDKLREIKSQLEEASANTDEYKERYESFSHDVDNKQMLVLQQLADMRREMNNMFDTMEEKAIEGVTHFGNILSTSIREEINVCKDLKKEMTQLTLKLGNEENKDECDVFINMVKAEKIVQKANRTMNELQDSNNIHNVADELQFDTNRNLSEQLQEIKLGQISCRYNINCTILKCNSCLGLHRPECKASGCFIEGIVQLDDGTYILADSSHFCLTWISQSYKVKYCAKLTEPPSALCITGSKKIAVCLPNKLEVFKINDGINKQPRLRLTFQHRCCGLAYFERKYYMTDYDSSVYIYNKNGHCIKTIKTVANKYVFETVRNIAIGEEARKVYVTDINRGLITLDMNGSVVSTLETKETKGAYGVCVTNDGHVLVTNYLTDNVIEVDEEGKNVLQKNLISLPSGQTPRSICYDRYNSCILLSNNHFEGSNFLSVFQH